MELIQDHEANELHDKVFASMETGNHANARMLMQEIKDVHFNLYSSIRADVLAEYGISL